MLRKKERQADGMERTRDRLRLRFRAVSVQNDPECAVVGGVIAHNLGHNCWQVDL